MPTILANTWENHFSANHSNEASNKSMSALFLSFNHQKTVEACISTASEEVDTIFIAKAPISNHIMFLHHFTKLGGTRTNPDEKYFVLVGTGSSLPSPNQQGTLLQLKRRLPCLHLGQRDCPHRRSIRIYTHHQSKFHPEDLPQLLPTPPVHRDSSHGI